ncbi:type II toxin-antitoxin system RnlB family antitoxin [Plebeiibacterium sediminum]|uniref:Type II toxin-antitoxin system RnlB family antitoxin n=1 Tax=Plebeiibacterium sediminum TaxID=2992112 RepID=A0AAE3SHA0_9BACT|nr:type II toxin-antitoxin system RnlB family antitoxin [Plebeiobacterium sediminum]MCW3789360.1 type II toxin-antitoxin system RnlB family antitoxin [Plebeiobacterium sediminum]
MKENQYFHIKNIEPNTVLVIATDVLSLDSYIDEIESALSQFNTDVIVYFDLLIKNGTNKRFYCADFNGKKKQVSGLKKCIPNERIQKYSDVYFKDNIQLINESLKIRKAEKWWIQKKGTLHLTVNC